MERLAANVQLNKESNLLACPDVSVDTLDWCEFLPGGARSAPVASAEKYQVTSKVKLTMNNRENS